MTKLVLEYRFGDARFGRNCANLGFKADAGRANERNEANEDWEAVPFRPATNWAQVPNSRRKFSRTAAANAPTGCPRQAASPCTASGRFAGWFSTRPVRGSRR